MSHTKSVTSLRATDEVLQDLFIGLHKTPLYLGNKNVLGNVEWLRDIFTSPLVVREPPQGILFCFWQIDCLKCIAHPFLQTKRIRSIGLNPICKV